MQDAGVNASREGRCGAGTRAKCHRSGVPAFTLIELVAVVGVLIVVIAMLMPALAKVQRQARTVNCLSNLRQLGVAFSTYTAQNSNHGFSRGASPDLLWISLLRPALAENASVQLCPEATELSYGWGTAKTAWGPYDALRSGQPWMSFVGGNFSSYGFNAWLYCTDDRPELPHPQNHFASHIPVFADSTWLDGQPFEDSTEDPSARRAKESVDTSGDLSRFSLARHGQSTNAGFFDGHAEQVPLDGGTLREMKWRPPLHKHHAGTARN